MAQNVGTATWGPDIAASYHWLDERGNAIVWDGMRTALPGPVAPGEQVELEIAVRAPMPPGSYGFALDLVAEHRAWFAELGADDNPSESVEVLPRIDATTLRDAATVHASSTTPEWESRVLALHAEGYAVVAGAIEAPRRLAQAPRAVGARPRPCPRLRRAAALPLRAARDRAGAPCRRRRPPGLPPARGRAVGLRRLAVL